jgi:hypothetical protein
MNAIQILSSQPWVERLGWTLVHFLWQGFSIAILYAAIRRVVMRTSSSHVRYLLACAAMGIMVAAPLVTWELMRPADTTYPIGSIARAASTAGIATAATAIALPAFVRATVSSVRPTPVLFWVVIVWLAGVLVFWARLIGAGW